MIGWLAATIVLLAAAAVAIAVWYYTRTLYAAPWFLLLGPTDADRAALLARSRQTAVPRRVRPGSATTTPGLSWHYFDSAAVVDVASELAFPANDPDVLGWERALQALKRYRPRRPIDGIVLAIPASMLSDADWLSRSHEIGAALRDRLLQAQRYFGFAFPVYVVVTQCESVRGFSAFARAVPQGLHSNMLGWSNPRAGHEPFSGDWVTEGFAELHRMIAVAQAELFATSPAADEHASELLLFSRDVTRLMPPLRALLEEVFRPGLHEGSPFFRGFYLSGQEAPATAVFDVTGPGRSRALIAAREAPALFVADLFDWKIFAERGLARPLPAHVRARRRGLWAARGAVALLALMLIAGVAYGSYKVRQVRAAYAALLTLGGDLLNQRQQLQRNERTLSPSERLAQSRQFLEHLQAIGPQRLGSVFLPASWIRSLDGRVSGVVTRVFGEVVLGDVREGVRHRAGTWLATDPTAGDPPAVSGPSLKDNPFYVRLERLAADYEAIAGGVRRYEQMARGQGPADLSGASDLLALLAGAPLSSPAVSPAIGRAVQNARGAPIGCDVFEDPKGTGSLVGARASKLLDEFGVASFGDDNPILTASTAFSEDWTALMEGTDEPEVLLNLMEDTTNLSSAVTAWGPIGTRSQALAIPAFDRAPFRLVPPDDRLCAALRPDLSPAIARVVTLRDQLSDRILALEVEPFGPLVLAGDKGLVLNDDIAGLKTDLDGLKGEGFWAPPPADASAAVPANPAWRPEVWDDTVKLVEAYEVYRGRGFGRLAVSHRQPLLAAVRAEVARLVSTRLLVTATAGDPPAADPQARIDEITALSAQLGKAARLVPLLASDSPNGANVLRALDQQALRALQDVDRLAAARYPSVFGQQFGAAFTSWNDLQRTAPGPDALKQWAAVVDDERNGIHQLGQLARPIVLFLSPRQRSDVVRRWDGVVGDVAGYDQKRPDNGLSALDAVLRQTVPSIAPEKGCVPPGPTTSRIGGGFLASVEKEIVTEGVRRCRVLVEQRYAAIASSFNRLLAGRIPFSAPSVPVSEVTPAQFVEFLKVYDQQQGRTLRPALEAQTCSADAVSFMRRLDSLDLLLGGLRAATPPGVTVDVLPEFRIVSPQGGVGGEQIAQWQMDIGPHTFDDSVPGKAAPWTSGSPVAVTLRFAQDSPHRPVSGEMNGRVQDRTVKFEFGGTWALLQLVRAGHAAVEVPRPAEQEPTVLGFQIGVERDPDTPPLTGAAPATPFTAFMRLRLYPAGKTDLVPIDDLPIQAPGRLSCVGN